MIPRRFVADGWVLPRFAERQLRTESGTFLSLGDVDFPENTEPRWTTTGAAGAPGRVVVDSRGLVTPRPGSWSLDWWVGAEDGWRVPSRDQRVTQSLLEDVPVVETRVRVPGGEAVQRVFGIPDGSTVVEFENASAIPFALAVAVRPFDQCGPVPLRSIRLEDGVVEVDGAPAMVLPKPPARVAVSTGAAGDVARTVMSGDAATGETFVVEDPEGAATAAMVFPLTHRTSLRVLLGRTMPAGALPSTAAVVRGWTAQLRPAARVVVPDERLQRIVDGARARLLLLDDGVAPLPTEPGDALAVIGALEAWGFEAHAAELRPAVPRRHRKRHRREPLGGVEAWSLVAALAASSSPTVAWPGRGTGDDGRTVADFLLALHDGLVREDGGAIAMLPASPVEWRGLPLEVHRLPVAGGRLSFAVRWHGERPALLWEWEGEPVELRCPHLDRGWTTRQVTGETLLA